VSVYARRQQEAKGRQNVKSAEVSGAPRKKKLSDNVDNRTVSAGVNRKLNLLEMMVLGRFPPPPPPFAIIANSAEVGRRLPFQCRSNPASPSAERRIQPVLRSERLSTTIQSPSSVGGIGTIFQPFNIPRSASEMGIFSSAV
jgi:hypothetical protein